MKEIEIITKAKVGIPWVPNNIVCDGGYVPIQKFTDDELKNIGENWTEELIKKARAKRAHQ